MGLGLSEIESGSVREKKKRALPPSVAVVVEMRGGGRAQSFQPWSFGREREREREREQCLRMFKKGWGTGLSLV